MATKKFSFGSSEVSATKKRGGGPSMGASTLAIGEGLNLRTPALQPQASAASTFYSPTAPNAPGATSVPQGSTVAKPSGDLENLANNLSSLNENLVRFSSTFIESQAKLNKAAEKRAQEVAIKLRETNGNVMGKYNDLLNQADKDSTNEKLSIEKQTLAKKNYDTLRAVDPRAANFLSRALEYQQGLHLVLNAPNYINNLTDKSGAIRILKPYTDDGSPSELDIELNNYYSQGGLKTPEVLLDLRETMVNTSANIKSQQASKYAAKQDERLLSGLNTNLNNMILERKNLGADYESGRALTGVLDQVRHAGMTNKTLNKVNEELIPTLASYAITVSLKPDGTLDQAKFVEIQEFLYKELAGAKTGPITQKNRPGLDTKLGTNPENQFLIASDDKANAMDLSNKRTNNRKWIGEANKDFDTALLQFNDSDPDKDGNQPYTFEVVDGDKTTTVTISADLRKLTTWYNNKLRELSGPNATGNAEERKVKRKQLTDRMKELTIGMTADLDVVEDRLNDFVRKVGVNPIFKKAEVVVASRNNLISKQTERDLLNIIEAEIRAQDNQSQQIINSYVDQALGFLGDAGASGQGLLSPLSTSADGIMDTNELIAARKILQPAMDQTNKILADKSLSQPEKLNKLDTLWSKYNKDIELLVKRSSDQRKLKLEGDLALHTRLESINAGNIEITPNDMDIKEKNVTIKLNDGTTYTTLPDGELYATDNEAFVRAENNIKESNEHYEKSKNYYEQLVKDGKIKEGELVINPYIEDERRLALRYGFRYAREGELINPANLDRMKEDIDLLIKQAEQLKDPVIQNNLHWTSFSSPSYTSRGTPIQDLQSLPATFTEDTDKQQMALTNATEFSRVEASQRFKGYSFGLTGPYGAKRDFKFEGTPWSDLENEYVKGWTALRTKEHFYKQGSGIDPSLRPGEATPVGGRSVLFGDTPWHIIDKIGHKRGRKADNAILNSDIRQRPLYQRYVFAEQINALEAGAPWIPYSHDLNIILDKAGVTPIDFFRQQYFVHTGNTMPAELEESITNRLIQKIDGVANPLYRKELGKQVNNKKDLAMISELKDTSLIAGDLQPGMLTSSIQDGQNISPRLATNRTKFLDNIHSVESTNGGYEAFNQRGVNKGKDVKGFSGSYGDHPANKGKRLVDLTIQEILNIQDSGYNFDLYPQTKAGDAKWDKSGGIHAAGRYQMTRGFIRDALRYSGINPNAKFSPDIQDQLAIAYALGIKERGQKLEEVWVGLSKNEKVLKEALKSLEELKKPEKTESSTIDPSSGLA